MSSRARGGSSLAESPSPRAALVLARGAALRDGEASEFARDREAESGATRLGQIKTKDFFRLAERFTARLHFRILVITIGEPMKAFRLAHVAGLVLALFVQFVSAETITGKVVGVHDGDTITVLSSGNKQTKVRFAQIDAPESRQDFGQASKQALSDLVFGKQVTVEVETVDKYGRTVGKVIAGGTDANLAQVKTGMAWVYRQYAKDPAYFSAEEAAKAAKVGLWSRPGAIPPWEYRHGKGGASTGADSAEGSPQASASSARPVAASSPASSGGSCGTKRYCKEMASCDEARHYLKDCGLAKLDKDGDGMPCESLCK